MYENSLSSTWSPLHVYLMYDRGDGLDKLVQAHGQTGCNRMHQENRVNTNEQDQCRKCIERDGFTPIRVGQPAPLCIERAIEDTFEHPEQVARGENHSEDRDDGHGRQRVIAAGERHIFRDESSQPGQAERSQASKGKEGCQKRHLFGDAAEKRDFARMRVMSPWLNIWMVAPVKAAMRKAMAPVLEAAATPSRMIPMWLTLE